MSFRVRFAVAVVSVSALVLQAGAANPQRFSAKNGARTKLHVSDREAAATLTAGGATLVADYGSFQVFEASRAAVAELAGRVDERADSYRIELNAGFVDTTNEAVRATRAPAMRRAAVTAGCTLHLVQFAGPVKPEWQEALLATGVRIVDYVPQNAYLVYGNADALAKLQALANGNPVIQFEGAYLDADKVQPSANRQTAKRLAGQAAGDEYQIQLVADDTANADTLAVIDALKLAPVRRINRVAHFVNVVATLPADSIGVLSAQPDIVSINAYSAPHKFDERQDIIVSGQLTGNAPSGPGYLAWLATKGFTQTQFDNSGLLVDVTDSGVDNGSASPNHFALYKSGDTASTSRVVYNRLEGTANSGSTIQGCDGHGNLNSHIIGGYVSLSNAPHTDSAGYRYGLGVCPFVKLGSSVIFDPSNFTTPDYENLISKAYNNGARISSDSWGADTAGDYDTDAQAYDYLVRDAQPTGSTFSVAGNQGMVICFAAGNAGSAAQTVGSPGTAKNVITVGAAENVHSHAITNGGANASGNDGCATPDSEANSANDVASFSSRGPCTDSRVKPEIMAPGTHVTGGVAQEIKTMAGTGNDLACFTAEGVCGGGTNSAGVYANFFPTNQQFYSTSSGTSHSTPAVAGGCALIYQWFLNTYVTSPSPAMVKALLMNGARYMTGVDANDTLPSNDQGMGMMDLGRIFDGSPRVLRDQRTDEVFTATGQQRAYTLQIVSNSKPVRVTLAWTDAPGGTSGNAYKNNLDLGVTVNGTLYRGNVFSGANSVAGGTADVRNNAESVFLPAGTTGKVVVTVTATSINSDGIPNFGGSLDQDFAVVLYNLEVATNQPPVLATIPNKSVGQSNTLTFAVSATDPADNDPITLSVSNAPAGSTFGATNGTGTFTWTNALPMGVYTQTFFAADKDGVVSQAMLITVTDGSCVPSNIVTENFDASTSLPAGWSGTSANDTASHYQSAPNARALGSGASVITPAVDYPTQITFYVDASNGGSGNSATLEYSTDGATFASVGSFVVSSSGGTKTFALTSAPDLSGSTGVTFRFASTFNTWYLDNVVIDGGCPGVVVPPAQVPPVLAAIGNKSVTESNTLAFAVTATDANSDPITLVASNLPAGATFGATNGNGTFTWAGATPTGTYSVTFHAFDDDGFDNETIAITVTGGSAPPGTSAVVFVETIGTVGTNGAAIASHESANQFDNDGFTMSGSGDIRNTSGSSGYTNASGTLNVMLNANGEYFQIAGIDTTGRTGMKLEFGVRKGSTSENGSTLIVEVSTDGSTWTQISPASAWLPSGTGTATWYYRTNDIPDAFASATLYLKFRSTGTVEWRLDDLKLTGSGGTPAQVPPVLAAIGNKSVQESNTLAFAVSATDANSDPITLVASNLPAGATFGVTNGNGTFTWSPATPTGTYSVTFHAYDDDGFDNETISIAVTNVGIPAQVPPVLAAIGSQSVTESNTLTFAVTATDANSDPITLVASNLPAGATFGATNGSGTFTWVSAAPTGTYSVSFFAVDDDGVDGATVAITVSPASPPADTNCAVLISEYVEGSSNNKAVEIFNPGVTPVDLLAGSYLLQIYANGSATPNNTIALTGTVAAGGTYVVSHSTAGATLLALAQQSSSLLTFNGDDAIVLRSGGAAGTVLDSVGVVGVDPGTQWGTAPNSTLDSTLRRKGTVTRGDTVLTNAFDSTVEWDGYAIDTFSGLGAHTNECTSGGGPVGTPPVFAAVTAQIVVVGGSLQFPVSAAQTEGDAVTLVASNLPVGAVFGSTNEFGSFLWTNATPVGVYTCLFYAVDNDGTVGTNVIVTVLTDDTDGDGIRDAWELQYFASLTNVSATSDWDGDGFADLSEFLAGSVPTNGQSLLKATSVASPAGGFVVTWQSESNKLYLLARSTNLLEGFIGIASNIPAVPPVNVYTDTTSTNATGVYRIELK